MAKAVAELLGRDVSRESLLLCGVLLLSPADDDAATVVAEADVAAGTAETAEDTVLAATPLVFRSFAELKSRLFSSLGSINSFSVSF